MMFYYFIRREEKYITRFILDGDHSTNTHLALIEELIATLLEMRQ